MKLDALKRMDESEIDELGRMYSIELAPCNSLEEKIEMIERRRSRGIIVRVLGIDFEIPIKRAHDKRISDIVGNLNATGMDSMEAITLLLGEAQTKMLVEACTDDDGVVDIDALALAFVKLFNSEKLKNY